MSLSLEVEAEAARTSGILSAAVWLVRRALSCVLPCCIRELDMLTGTEDSVRLFISFVRPANYRVRQGTGLWHDLQFSTTSGRSIRRDVTSVSVSALTC